jgi:hypothetical protein
MPIANPSAIYQKELAVKITSLPKSLRFLLFCPLMGRNVCVTFSSFLMKADMIGSRQTTTQ